MKIGKLFCIGLSLLLCACSASTVSETAEETEVTINQLNGSGTEDFDLTFLKMENNEKSMLYSPLSIKYALSMLKDGASGNSASQIKNVIGDYVPSIITSNANMSLANALFVKEGYTIKEDYINTIKDKYDGDVISDSFTTPDNLNAYISEKTFDLINDYYDDVSDLDYILMNTLAIDMEWVNKIQLAMLYSCPHESFYKLVEELATWNITSKDFNGTEMEGVEFGAAFNKYDIVNELGEESIRNTVTQAYEKYKQEYGDEIPDMNAYLDNYIREIDSNYGTGDCDTDFEYYIDDNVKVFAKDLKEYEGTTLQYVAIMPISESLSDYIAEVTGEDIDNLINSLITPVIDNMEEGIATRIDGWVPVFNYDYTLDLMNDLQQLGITDVFDENKADLSNMTDDAKAYIGNAGHKTTIEFSNEGIKAAAITEMGGLGAAGGFDYIYDIPIKVIDLTFDQPFLYLIRNKATGEVWFTGTLYGSAGSHTTASEETNNAQGSIKVKVDKLNTRSEPTTTAEKCGQLFTGETYDFYSSYVCEGYTWYQLDGRWVADDGTWLEVTWN